MIRAKASANKKLPIPKEGGVFSEGPVCLNEPASVREVAQVPRPPAHTVWVRDERKH